jgi:predicted dehydrogenase
MRPKLAILGMGRVFKKMARGIHRWFAIDIVFDPNPDAAGWTELSETEPTTTATSEDEFFRLSARSDAILVLSPPAEHVRHVELAAPLHKAVFVEKPLAIDFDGLRRIDRAIRANSRVYFSDFYVDVRAALLVRAFGARPDAFDWITSKIQDRVGMPIVNGLRDRLGPILSIQATLLEGEGEAKTVDTRPWLREPQGGGVLLDLACHHLALYFALFGKPLEVNHAKLGFHPSGATGMAYEPWRPGGAFAETYALLNLQTSTGLPVRIEVAKNWDRDSRKFQIEGLNGSATLDFGSLNGPKNRLLTNISGQEGAVILAQNYWDFVAEGFYHYFKSGSEGTHGYSQGRAAVETIIHAKEMVKMEPEPGN